MGFKQSEGLGLKKLRSQAIFFSQRSARWFAVMGFEQRAELGELRKFTAKQFFSSGASRVASTNGEFGKRKLTEGIFFSITSRVVVMGVGYEF